MSSLASPPSQTGVVLTQLGGPDTLDDVQPFLQNFFEDLIPDNIPVPAPFVRPLARLLSRWRAPHSRGLYASIGGGSPLRAQTEAQAEALRQELRRRGRSLPVYVAMRNWHPHSKEALSAARRDGVDRIMVVPLYPQYSFSTTRSSLNELRHTLMRLRYAPHLSIVEEYCDHPEYIEAVASLTRRYLDSFKAAPDAIHLIFSAHGLPLKYINRGDPYLTQVKRSMAAVIAMLGHPGPAHLSFQSRLGPAKWLQPCSEALIKKLAAEGAKAMCVVPIAFVSEHVETLNEIDLQYFEVAKRHGVAEFQRVCTVRCHPAYIRCLANLVERNLAIVAPTPEPA